MENRLNNQEQSLCVKALAQGLGVSIRYVYEMRRCGFRMKGNGRSNRTSTVTKAVRWIQKYNFRIVRGTGRRWKRQSIHGNVSGHRHGS